TPPSERLSGKSPFAERKATSRTASEAEREVRMSAKWPKVFPPLTPEQQRISDDFMKTWLEVLPQRYGAIERFNHRYPVPAAPASRRTVETGAGRGEPRNYEAPPPEQRPNSPAAVSPPNIPAELSRRCPDIHVVTGDCQQRLDSPDGYFDRIMAIHVLEHLP